MRANFAGRQLSSSTILVSALLVALFSQAFAQHAAEPAAANSTAAARLKKLTPQEKARIFGTSQSWQQKYDERFKTAPPDVQKRILAERADIQKRGKKYTVGYTSMSGVQEKKITGLLGLPPIMRRPRVHLAPPPQQISCLEEAAQPSASAVDMRDYAIVTPVRQQGGCGDCWAFGTTAGLETAVLLANGNYQGVTNSTLDLAEEQVLSCTGPTDFIFGIQISGDDCGGGLQPSAANYLSEHSLVANSSWPYIGASQSSECNRFQSQSTHYKARDWGWICDPGSNGILSEVAVLTGIESSCLTPSNDAIKRAIVDHGSVVASINVGGECGTSTSPPFCDFTGDGVYDENYGTHYLSVPQVDHVIQMVGWDDSKQAWLIKNSWGADWGENGFAWVAYNTNNIGSYAIWLDAEQYNNACIVQKGLKFKSFTVDITTGGDDARDNSEVYATLNTGFEFCLKPSSSGPTAHCKLHNNVDQNGQNHWDNFYTNSHPQVFNLPQAASLENMTITLLSHSGFAQSADNWDIQAITVMGTDQNSGQERLLNIGNPGDHNGNNCFARLKDSPNSQSVILSLDGKNTHKYVGGKENGEVSTCSNNGG